MKLDILHTTTYSYTQPVIDSVNEVRLSPRNNYRQYCNNHELAVEPNVPIFSYQDYFDNRVHAFTVCEPHTELKIKMHAIVVTSENEPRQGSKLSPKEEHSIISSDKFQNKYAEYLLPTPYTEVTKAVQEYASSLSLLYNPATTAFEKIVYLCDTINKSFEYKPGVTNVHTKTDETINLKCGVCQDFTHLMIAICRHINIPARYVSGYHYVTDTLNGNDFTEASHAWIEIHIPGVGWIGMDPTNNSSMNGRYVKMADGRDYKDITPAKGAYKGNAEQTMTVKVQVKKLDDE